MDKTSLNIKRAMVWGISFATAFVLSLIIVYGPAPLLETDIDTYSVKYFILTVIPMGFIFLVWGDVLLGTKILPD